MKIRCYALRKAGRPFVLCAFVGLVAADADATQPFDDPLGSVEK